MLGLRTKEDAPLPAKADELIVVFVNVMPVDDDLSRTLRGHRAQECCHDLHQDRQLALAKLEHLYVPFGNPVSSHGAILP